MDAVAEAQPETVSARVTYLADRWELQVGAE
jgi:hypothetical protein